MILESSRTIEELEKLKHEKLEMQGHPFCDHLMFMDLSETIKDIEETIESLKARNRNEIH